MLFWILTFPLLMVNAAFLEGAFLAKELDLNFVHTFHTRKTVCFLSFFPFFFFWVIRKFCCLLSLKDEYRG